jgi:uncharacterized protein YjlB
MPIYSRAQVHRFADDGTFPNSRFPALVYRGVAQVTAGAAAPEAFEALFRGNGWGSASWRNGLYGVHHYHSTAHEVLGVFGGAVRIQLGGPQGTPVEVQAGDVVVIPAGVAHKNLGATREFRVVGAYPAGTSPDMNYGERGERPGADRNIARVPFPGGDPVGGPRGELMVHWGKLR